MTNITRVKTFTATIYVGMHKNDGPFGYDADMKDAVQFLQMYCDVVGLCVTIKPTKFIYTGGYENGIEVGLINYPRFPKELQEIKDQALNIAKSLMVLYNQKGVSIVFPDETIMLGEGSNPNE